MDTIKKSISILLIFILFSYSLGNADGYGKNIHITAKSAILINPDTNEILYEKNADNRMPMASTTKIMTLIIVGDMLKSGRISLNDTVIVSRNAANAEGSGIKAAFGDTLTVSECIKAIVLQSANNAAIAMAEHISGNDKKFVKLMNNKAKYLRLKNTNFINCHGLDANNHYSSAYDIAVMSKELLKYDLLVPYLSLKTANIKNGKIKLHNTNELIGSYDGIIGIKTGTTTTAQSCISAAARRDGITLVCVLLNCASSKDRYTASKELLDFGFSEYKQIYGDNIFTRLMILNGRYKPKISHYKYTNFLFNVTEPKYL